ncbi:intramolecular oxidoreductase [Fragilaria crotonensis]|nr:intramolecular oxidoreductase [Fragilaria crotonensis]
MIRRLWTSRLLALLYFTQLSLSRTIAGDVDTLNSWEEKSNDFGVLVLSNVDQVNDLLHRNESILLLVALYSPSCPFSNKLLKTLDHAATSLSDYFGAIDLVSGHMASLPPRIAKIDSSKVDRSWIQTLGIDAYPALFFFRQVKDETVVMEYSGLKRDPIDIVDTTLHCWYRHALGPIFTMDDVQQLQLFVRKHGMGFLRHVVPSINPDYSQSEQDVIRWLMNSNDDEPDRYTLLVECKDSPSKSLSALAAIVATQRDVALFSIADCANVGAHDGILSIRVDPNTWEFGGVRLKPPEMSLRQFAVIMSTPSVLLYDRISTGPIAFAKHRQIHAILFVRLSYDHSSHLAIRSFQRCCQEVRNNHEEDMVCMVVSETETRIMTQFGIDTWTSLDAKVSHGTSGAEVLPVLLITDQRNEKFRRYYLDAVDVVGDVNNIQKFMDAFWNGELTPERKSSVKTAHRNSHGVEIISGNDFSRVILERQDKHTLLYLHSPTCGHCKRFASVWNELARMVKAAKWDSFLDIVQIDATENEIIEVNIDPGFLPALYYLPSPNKKDFVQFDVQDEAGESVGRLRDPTEILDWMLSQGDFDTDNLLQLIGDAEHVEAEEAIEG